MNGTFHWLLPAASTMAARVDTLFFAVLLLTGTVGLVLIVLMAYFCVKYRSGAHADRSHPPSNRLALEIAWTVTPLLVFLALFTWAAYDYSAYYSPPADALPVFVVAKQWMWKLQHANGRREIDELHVPLGQPVRIIMTSQDVIHSFFVPAFRVKQDVVPGRYTSLWFTPTQLGEFPIFCAEYCGSQHAVMRARVVVMQPAQFARWLREGTVSPTLAAHGFDLFRQFGCSGCHDPRSSVHAPDLTGLIGRSVHLRDGRTIIADENYVRDSVLLPTKDVVAGFAPIMPSFAGQVSEEDIQALIEYIRSTGNASGEKREPGQ
jgi:cytochrome c oxidase subunit II